MKGSQDVGEVVFRLVTPGGGGHSGAFVREAGGVVCFSCGLGGRRGSRVGASFFSVLRVIVVPAARVLCVLLFFLLGGSVLWSLRRFPRPRRVRRRL